MPVTLIASDCPLPVVPGTAPTLAQVEAGSASPPTSRSQSSGGMQPVVSSKLNRNAAAQDLGSRFGAGGHAVVEGLAVTAGAGLSIDVSAGLALIDGLVEYAGGNVVVSPSVSRGWVWLTQAGSINIAVTTAKPVSNCVLLGSFVSDGSGITSVDSSGVVSFVGGVLERQTADPLAPSDSPSASWRGFTRTLSGLWYWDGVRHGEVLQSRGRLAKSVAGGVDVTLAATEAAARILTLSGVITANINLIVPSTDGREWIVFNSTTGAFTVTVKTAAGTGIVVAQTKHAIVYCDGTNVLRVTADA